eukprot:4326211-Alexandrium_andersonii.AAC.1
MQRSSAPARFIAHDILCDSVATRPKGRAGVGPSEAEAAGRSQSGRGPRSPPACARQAARAS